MKASTGRIAAAAVLTAGIPFLAAGCSFGGDDTPATTSQATTTVVETQAPATTTAAPATTTAAPATTTAAAASSATVAPPAGAKQLAETNKNGATYQHFSITGTTPAAVVSGYQSELEAAGYTVNSTGGGGGGWGGYGGSGAGITSNNGSQWINVEAGGQNSGPTYFEVCTGPSKASVNDCEDLADNESNSHNS